MARGPRGNAPAAPPPEQEELEESYTIADLTADLTAEQVNGMQEALAGKGKPLGGNVACNGFFKKAPGVQIVGRVVSHAVRQSTLNPDVEDEILFIQGFVDVPEDIKSRAGKVTTPKGQYQGTFGYQIDAGSMALSGCGPGTRVHAKVKELVDLSGGRTRWVYDFIRMRAAD